MRPIAIAALTASVLSLFVLAAAYGAEAPKPNTPIKPNSTNPYPSFLPAPAAATFKTKALVALYESDEGGGIRRSKNVRKVAQPSIGLYCIYTVSSVRLDPANIYPIVTVEWTESEGNALLAYIADGRTECGDGANIEHTLEVKTYDFSSGTPVLSNGVAFFLTVQ